MADNPLLMIWLYPTAGEPFVVSSTDFDSTEAALQALEVAFGGGAPFRVTEYREHEATTTLMINPANVIAARVGSATSAGETGQYL